MKRSLSTPPRKVLIDVTGIIRWGVQPPTGVQRVEQAICKVALSRDGSDFVAFDSLFARYRRLSGRDRSFLDAILLGSSRKGKGGYWARLRSAFRFVDVQFKYQDNETSRRLAQAVIGGRPRRGVAFEVAKAAVRIVQWFYLVGYALLCGLTGVGERMFGRRRDPAPASIILVSHEVNRHWLLDGALRQHGLNAVHVVYDLIPTIQPELTSARFSRRMSDFFFRVLTRPEPAIAISHATKMDLLRWNDEVVKAEYPFDVKVCPLGAALSVRSRSPRPVDGVRSSRSFVLYCSTFDIRKNHAFLVSLWARLAKEIGDAALPDLVLVGRRGNATPLVDAELAKAPELAGRVHVLSGIGDDELIWLYQNAAFGVFPSTAEGWGLGVSECLANGLPAVVSDVAALKEAAQGLMPAIPVLDFDGWLGTLRALIEEPQRLKTLRAVIKERYDPGSPDGFGGDVIDYLELLAREGLNAARLPAKISA